MVEVAAEAAKTELLDKDLQEMDLAVEVEPVDKVEVGEDLELTEIQEELIRGVETTLEVAAEALEQQVEDQTEVTDLVQDLFQVLTGLVVHSLVAAELELTNILAVQIQADLAAEELVEVLEQKVDKEQMDLDLVEEVPLQKVLTNNLVETVETELFL